ncbi:glycine betaine ABC transporter substrate-binding protein [Gluconobacter wancherniae]|uniref:glycine betaine ABC transporter substrate-binding protein n=1 Tax=Gluconobacter wancherniae TaxID=1307955 RepID=UPI001B8A8E55|nr:glycine betaine ABC transporter substrate-binding protein [Gluconobacter wancherniae]MBS1061575.1 hypothetical protein [Gluconobacter wancherniae]MBS1093660.1 hypothetical protein [Gluconobacter wancherniae]
MTQMTIGHLYTSLHAGCASAVARVLEANGVEVEFSDLDADDIAEVLESGEIDLLVSSWFPRDEKFMGPGLRIIGDLYQPVTSFAAFEPLGPIETLLASDFDRVIVADDSREAFDSASARLPALSDLPVEIVGEGALVEQLEKAQAMGSRPLVVATQPHAIFHLPLLHVIEDSASLLGKEMSARMIIRDDAARNADQDLLDELSEMMLGNKVMSALDYAIGVEGQDPDDAAEAWQRGRLLPR